MVQIPPVLIVTRPLKVGVTTLEDIVKVIALSTVKLAQVSAVASTVQLAWISTLSVVIGTPLGFQFPAMLQFPLFTNTFIFE